MLCNERSDIASASSSAGAIAFLQLTKRFARSPRRMLTPGVYLIGFGRDCRIRLGDEALPERHSRLWISSKEAVIETLGSELTVIVNGTAMKRALLRDGDLLEIGSVRMVFRHECEELSQNIAHGKKIESTGPKTCSVQTEQDSIADMSAAELVDSMAAAMEVVEELEQSRTSMLRNLLAVAAESGRTATNADETDLASRSDARQIHQLEHCVDRIDSLEQVIGQILQQQQMMADALHAVTQHVAGQIVPAPQTARRASA